MRGKLVAVVRLARGLPLPGMSDTNPHDVRWPCVEVQIAWIDSVRRRACAFYVETLGWPDLPGEHDQAEAVVLFLTTHHVNKN